MHIRKRSYRWLGGALALVLVAGCAGSVPRTESTLAPAMVLERFLRAANSNDLDAMGDLFGTKDGPWAPTVSRKDADDRLFTLASVLRHTDYQILGEQIVPGRRDEATQLVVRLTMGENRYDVPFTLVQSSRHGWLVENVPVELLTNRRSGGSRPR
jgi:hypothetical protein